MKKSLIEVELIIGIRDFETKKLKTVIKIAKIKKKKIENIKDGLTQVIIGK